MVWGTGLGDAGGDFRVERQVEHKRPAKDFALCHERLSRYKLRVLSVAHLGQGQGRGCEKGWA